MPVLSGSEQLTSEYPDGYGVLPWVMNPPNPAELSALLDQAHKVGTVFEAASVASDPYQWFAAAPPPSPGACRQTS